MATPVRRGLDPPLAAEDGPVLTVVGSDAEAAAMGLDIEQLKDLPREIDR